MLNLPLFRCCSGLCSVRLSSNGLVLSSVAVVVGAYPQMLFHSVPPPSPSLPLSLARFSLQGPYRESFAEYCAELQSDALPLFIRCPNAVNNVGINREKWVPNPAFDGGAAGAADCTNSRHLEMLSFLGRLMGVAIRSRQPLDLDLPSIVWKQIVRSPITV